MLMTEEVRRAIHCMKNSCMHGEDGIVAELIKYGREPVASALTRIIKDAWTIEKNAKILEH